MGLVDELGFDAVDADGLDNCWRQQPGTDGVRRGLSEASPGRALLPRPAPEESSGARAPSTRGQTMPGEPAGIHRHLIGAP